MKLDPKKRYLVTYGELLDDGTVNVESVGGEVILKAGDVEKLLQLSPDPTSDTLRVYELKGTFTADCKWKERS